MYTCASCNKTSKPGESLNKRVLFTRAKTYINEGAKTPEKRTTHGFETVKEIGVCGKCLDVLVRSENYVPR